MRKLLSKIAGTLLGLSLAMGVGVAINGNKKVAKTVDATGSETFVAGTDTSSTSSLTKGDITISVSSGTLSRTDNYRCYANYTMTIETSNGTLSQIDFTFSGSNTGGWSTSYTGLSSASWTSASASGQARITQIVVTYEPSSSATLSSIALSGSMTKTSYTTADSWDPSGLTVTGTYSDKSTKNLTSASTFTYYNSSDVEVASPSALGIGSGQTLKVVASYTGVSDTAKYTASTAISVSKAVEYELVTDPSKLTKGTEFMFVASSTVTKAMKQSRTTSNGASDVADVTLSSSFNSGSVATSSEGTVFTLDGSAGAWKIKNGDNQLGFTGSSNNNMQFNENQTDTFKITTQSGYLLSVESNAQSGRKLQYNYNNGSPRFSNYNGGQTYIYMFACIAEASYGTTDHITISASPQTEFASGETFNSTGLAITAWDGANEETANSKSVEVTSVSLTGTTFDDEDIGLQTVTVTYSENDVNYQCAYDIYVYAAATYELVTAEPTGGWTGSYLITSTVSTATDAIPSTGTYAMKSTLDNFDVVGNYASVTPVTTDGVTSIVAGQHLQFSIATTSGGYSIQGQSGKYIGWGSASNNGLTTSASPLVNTLSISGSDVTILCSAGTKGLTLSSSSGQFRYYSNSSVKLYKLVESSAVKDFAQLFLSAFTCDDSGETKPTFAIKEGTTYWSWSLLKDEFDAMGGADRQQLTQGAADKNGDEIGQALARYDYIVGKYYKTGVDTSFTDFMSRNPAPIVGTNIVGTNYYSNSNSSTIIIVVVALTSITSIGVLLVIKRKRSLVK